MPFQYLALKGKQVSFHVANYSHISCFTTEIGIVICSLLSLRTSCSRSVIYSTISAFVKFKQLLEQEHLYFFYALRTMSHAIREKKVSTWKQKGCYFKDVQKQIKLSYLKETHARSLLLLTRNRNEHLSMSKY